jgi:hypothetical protein
MAEELKESKIEITLDGKAITLEQLEEAKSNKSVRIIEDKNKPGTYRTLKRMVD